MRPTRRGVQKNGEIQMTGRTWFLAAALGAALIAGAAWAQDDTTGAPTAVDTTDGSDLSVGTPVEGAGGEAGIGQSYIADTFGDWEIRCLRVAEGEPEPCQMYQLLTDSQGSPVAEFNIFDLPDSDPVVAGATIVTPLDTLLTGQLRIQIGTREPLLYPFRFCQPVGCFVRVGLTEANLDDYRAGATATITIVPLQAPDQTVDLEASLSGFTAAFDDLSERSAAAQAQAGDAAADTEASE